MAKIDRDNKRKRRDKKTTIIRKFKKPKLMYVNFALIVYLLVDKYSLHKVLKDLLEKL